MQAAPFSPPLVAWDRSTLMTSPSTPSSRFASDVMAGVRAQAWVEEVIGRSLEGSFAEALKDGQGLCCLVNRIRPGTIARIETSKSPFKQMANISSFIRGCKTLGVRETSLFETLDLYNEKRLPQVARCLFSLSEVARKNMPDFPGPYLSALDRPEVDPAIKAVVDIAKGNAPAPPWATKPPTPVTPRKMAEFAADCNTAGNIHSVHSGSVLGTPSRSVRLTLPNRENSAAAIEPSCCLSPAAHAAGQLTYGIYEGGGGDSRPLAIPSGRTHMHVDDDTPHRSRDRAGVLNGADGHHKDTSIDKGRRRTSSREEELRRRKQALSQVDAEMEVALWIEGVTGVTFPGKFWSSLKDGVLLCQVVNAIKPGLIPTINTARAPFPEMENISAFLAACRTLGVAEHSLFDTKDLHEKRDLEVVVRCLHVLGATVQTTVPSFRGPFLGKKSEACSTVNARGLRKRLGKGPGAQGGIPLAGLKECYVVDDTKKNVADRSPNKRDGIRTDTLNADHQDGNATATITPAESPSGSRGLFRPAVSGSGAGSAALQVASAKLEASQRSLSPPPPRGLLARVSSPLRGTSPLGRKWRRINPCTHQKGIGAGEGDFVPSLILEDVPEGTVPEVPTLAETRLAVQGGVPGEMKMADPHPEELVLIGDSEPDKTAAERVSRKAHDVAADRADGGGEHGDFRGANVGSKHVVPDHNAEHVDDSADVVGQVQTFVESNTRMPWRVDGDMFESLRDGWQLGLLANSLRPGAIRRVHNSIMPAKHVHNICNFVTACRRMGVANAIIFDVPDLYAKRDLTKVSRTLLSLRALAADPDFAHAQRRSSLMESSLLKSAAARAAANVGIGKREDFGRLRHDDAMVFVWGEGRQ